MNFSGVVKRIIDLAEQTTTSDTDCIPIGGTTLKRITIANLRKALGIDSLYEKNDDLSNSVSSLNSNLDGVMKNTSLLNIAGMQIYLCYIGKAVFISMRGTTTSKMTAGTTYGTKMYGHIPNDGIGNILLTSIYGGQLMLNKNSGELQFIPYADIPSGTWVAGACVIVDY